MKPSLIVFLAELCTTISLKFIDEFLDQIHCPCQTFFFGQHRERCAMFGIVQLDNVIDANCRVGVAYIKTTTFKIYMVKILISIQMHISIILIIITVQYVLIVDFQTEGRILLTLLLASAHIFHQFRQFKYPVSKCTIGDQ